MKERSTWFALVRRCLIPALFAVAVLLFTSGRVHAADEETQTAGEAEQEITQESVSVDDADAVQNVASETADDEAAVLADDSSNAQIADDSDEELPGGGYKQDAVTAPEQSEDSADPADTTGLQETSADDEDSAAADDEDSAAADDEDSTTADDEDSATADTIIVPDETADDDSAVNNDTNSEEDDTITGEDADASEKLTAAAASDNAVVLLAASTADQGVDVYRLYSSIVKEHLYTTSYHERDVCMLNGWSYEGIGWTAPSTSSTPIYRLYNPAVREHLYTTDLNEKNVLSKRGWIYEMIACYSADSKEVPVYREYLPGFYRHNYSISKNEHNTLVSRGWHNEGVAWYGIVDPNPVPDHPVTVYAGCDLSSIYDFNYYESNNPDIKAKYGNNDMGALEHFVVFGLSENRQGKSSYSSTDYQAAKYHFEALRVLNRIGHSLRAAFNYSCMKYVRNNSLTNPSYGTHYYAHIGLTQHKGNCYVMAATFCELAKALGYNAVQVSGVVPLRSGGLGPHSWVELGGYVYDPDFQVESGKSGYKIYYGKPGTWRYYKQQYMSA